MHKVSVSVPELLFSIVKCSSQVLPKFKSFDTSSLFTNAGGGGGGGGGGTSAVIVVLVFVVAVAAVGDTVVVV